MDKTGNIISTARNITKRFDYIAEGDYIYYMYEDEDQLLSDLAALRETGLEARGVPGSPESFATLSIRIY